MSNNKILGKNNIFFVLAVLVVAGVVFFFVWRNFHKPNVIETLPEPAEISVPAVEVSKRVLFREDQLPGEINAYQDVLIYPKVPGFVEWIGVDRGSIVKKGQLMVKIYAPEYMARRSEAMAKIAAAKAELAAEESRLQDLQADLKRRQANLLADESTYQRVYAASLLPGVIADNDVVQWAQSVEQDRQDVNTAMKRVNAKGHEVSMRKEEVNAMVKAFENYADFASYLEINAPFDGYITDRKLHVGSFVGPDGTGAYPPICRIKQLDLLRIVAPVPELDTAGVLLGSDVEFTVSAFPGRKFLGTVARISNNLDKNTRTMPVELNYFNPKFEVLPGMFCKIYWPTRRKKPSLFVPISSVVSTPLNTFVCKLAGGVIEWVSVRKGQLMGNMIEVFGNIKEGDLVAKDGSEELENNTKAKAVVVSFKEELSESAEPGAEFEPGTTSSESSPEEAQKQPEMGGDKNSQNTQEPSKTGDSESKED